MSFQGGFIRGILLTDEVIQEGVLDLNIARVQTHQVVQKLLVTGVSLVVTSALLVVTIRL